MNRNVTSCENYLKEDFGGRSRNRSEPVVIFANLDSEMECSVGEKQVRNPGDILLLGENWNYRSSSPFPEKVQSFKRWKKIPVFSLRQKDVEEFEKARQNPHSKIRIIERNQLPALMRHDSDLFTVDCNEDECLDITRSCANDNLDGVFLGFKSLARRNVMVSVSCRDQGRSCRELKRRKKNEKKALSECQKTVVTPKMYSVKKLALRCKWQKTNKDRALTACGRHSENLQKNIENRCCSKNQTNIFFRAGCRAESGKKPILCDRDWSGWSDWFGTLNTEVFTRWKSITFVIFEILPTFVLYMTTLLSRYRLCYASPTCSYLETEYAKNKDCSSRPENFDQELQCRLNQNLCPW